MDNAVLEFILAKNLGDNWWGYVLRRAIATICPVGIMAVLATISKIKTVTISGDSLHGLPTIITVLKLPTHEMPLTKRPHTNHQPTRVLPVSIMAVIVASHKVKMVYILRHHRLHGAETIAMPLGHPNHKIAITRRLHINHQSTIITAKCPINTVATMLAALMAKPVVISRYHLCYLGTAAMPL